MRPALLLDLWVGEELVQAVHAVPEVEDQEFPAPDWASIVDVHHVTEVTHARAAATFAACVCGFVVDGLGRF